MKLADIKGDAAWDALSIVIENIAGIAKDEDVAELWKKTPVKKGQNPYVIVAAKVQKAVPSMLNNHREELVNIFAALNCMTPEEYSKEVSAGRILADVVNLLNDESIAPFLS